MPLKHTNVQPHSQFAGLRAVIGHREGDNESPTEPPRPQDKTQMPLRVQVLRFTGLAAALWYVAASFQSVVASVAVLRGLEYHQVEPEIYSASLIARYTGGATIAASPLIQDILGGDTTPRSDDMLFLESADSHSFEGCTSVDGFNPKLYDPVYLRFLFGELQEHMAYNVSLMDEVELIVPVVDCTFTGLVITDNNALRVYYLVRQVSDPSLIYILSTSMAVQNYYIDQQHQLGAALFVTIAIIEDMSASSVDYHLAIALNYPYVDDPHFIVCEFVGITPDGFWNIREVPASPLINPQRDILTAWREGFYIDDPSSQSNIKNWHWSLATDPIAEVNAQSWYAKTVQRDSWAWVHGIHALFGFYFTFQLGVLIFVMYRSLLNGHVWIGDAFAAISNTLISRGVLVGISNQMDRYFTWTEFSLAIGYPMSGFSNIYYRPELLQGDLLTFFLTVSTVLSYITKERVEPMVVIISFVIGSQLSNIHGGLPGASAILEWYAKRDHARGEVHKSEFLQELSPFAFQTVHPADTNMLHQIPAIMAASASYLSANLYVIVFIIVQKLYQRRKDRALIQQRLTKQRRRSTGSSFRLLPLTRFESATGARLKKPFGVLAAYDNYVDVDGAHYATADAVYSNGFVVANKKFVVAIDDLLSILAMKVTRVRLANVFVYELIDGETMKQTALLVYPSTLSWTDLLHLGVSRLA